MQILKYLEKQSAAFVFVFGLITILFFGLADYLTGYETSLAIFYLFPVSAIVWRCGKNVGFIASLVSTAVWDISNALSGKHYSEPIIHEWNIFARICYFYIVTILLVKLKAVLEEERKLARLDSLTGAANSRAFYEVTRSELSRARRHNHCFTIAYLDLDNFKAVNDQSGHSVGDDLLQTVAQIIKTNLRESDTIARLGGDEFAILLPETSYDAARIAIDKIQKLVLDEMQRSQWPVTMSIGMITCDEPTRTVDEIIKVADDLMYRVKNSGKNHILHERR